MNDKEIVQLVHDIVINVFSWATVVLVGVILLRRPLGALIAALARRIPELSELKAPGVTVGFGPPRTVETALGETNVSAIPTSFNTDSHMFYSRAYGFEISYPISPDWVADFHPGDDPSFQGLKLAGFIPVFLVKTASPFEGFMPNVNVLAQPVGDMSITQYVAQTIAAFIKMNATLRFYEIDAKTNGAMLTYDWQFAGENGAATPKLHFVCRVTISKGVALVATSTIKEDSQFRMPVQMREELNGMLNSFHAVKSTTRTEPSGKESKVSGKGK
jgi:hypothetical protein